MAVNESFLSNVSLLSHSLVTSVSVASEATLPIIAQTPSFNSTGDDQTLPSDHLMDLTTNPSANFDNISSVKITTIVPFLVSNSTTSSGEPAYLCDGRWMPVHHLYFQLANLFLFLSYLAPNGIYGILYLRVTLCIGCFFFSLWGWVVLCAFDTVLWNAIFVVINLTHVMIISYSLRPVRFSAELEQVRM